MAYLNVIHMQLSRVLGSVVVKALCYKSEGLGFDKR
jgi:hypothetical protein